MKNNHSKIGCSVDNMQFPEEKVDIVNELHKPARKNFARRRTIIKGLDDLWQCDLAQMDIYAGENENHKFILVVIDCFSKFVWVKALKTKTAEEVTRAFTEILQRGKRSPKNLQTDQGTEFFNGKFQRLMKEYKINHYNTFTIKKAAIVERVIRTLKEKLFKYFSLKGSYKWLSVLPEIVDAYNNTKHRTIGMKPRDVNKSNEVRLLKTSYNHIKVVASHKFEIGTKVRISRSKHVFSKSYLPNWSTEIFEIVKVQITNPVTYLLKDENGNPILGAFYEHELQKTLHPDVFLVEKILKKHNRKYFVKWLGFSNEYNSWIDAENIL